MSGTVKAVNFRLLHSPDLLNEAPEHDGWLYRLENIDDYEWKKLPLLGEWDSVPVSTGSGFVDTIPSSENGCER
jgi:hypothetical protein